MALATSAKNKAPRRGRRLPLPEPPMHLLGTFLQASSPACCGWRRRVPGAFSEPPPQADGKAPLLGPLETAFNYALVPLGGALAVIGAAMTLKAA